MIYKTMFKTHNLEPMTNLSFVHFKFVSSLKNLSTFTLKLLNILGLSTFWLKTLPTFSFYNHLFVSTCLLHPHLSESSITHIWPCSPSRSSQNTRPYSNDFSPLLPFDESLSCIPIVITISTKIEGFNIGFGHKKVDIVNNFSMHAILLLWVEML